jgi:hypothetical protein
VKLTGRLSGARALYGRHVHLREMPDGLKQVIAYRGPQWVGVRDETGVEVVAWSWFSWRKLLGGAA